MDLNQLYSDHQVLLMRARTAGHGERRRVHETNARQIAAQIGCIQHRSGATAARAWLAQSARPGAALSAAATANGLVP
jgi:cytosine/adenosine deaminase-related metal-dependent hydrolase